MNEELKEIALNGISWVEEFPVAEPIRVIVNLKNNGVAVYNITNCLGSLNNMDDFSVYHQNVGINININRSIIKITYSSLRETSTLPCILDMR